MTGTPPSYVSSGTAIGGYAYVYSSTTSSSTLGSTGFCACGQTGPSTTLDYAGLGVSVSQAMATSATSPPVLEVPITGSGITYALSSLPTQGARLIIDNGPMGANRNDYCATLTAPSGTIPWSMFNQTCYAPTAAGALAAAPTKATHIQIGVVAIATATPFDFCVTALSIAP